MVLPSKANFILSRLSNLCLALYAFTSCNAVLISLKYGFDSLCLWRSLVRFTSIGINLCLLFILVKISPLNMISNIMHICFASLIMYFFSLFIPQTENLLMQLFYVFVCMLVYFFTILFFKQERDILTNLKYNLIRNNTK